MLGRHNSHSRSHYQYGPVIYGICPVVVQPCPSWFPSHELVESAKLDQCLQHLLSHQHQPQKEQQKEPKHHRDQTQTTPSTACCYSQTDSQERAFTWQEVSVAGEQSTQDEDDVTAIECQCMLVNQSEWWQWLHIGILLQKLIGFRIKSVIYVDHSLAVARSGERKVPGT